MQILKAFTQPKTIETKPTKVGNSLHKSQPKKV